MKKKLSILTLTSAGALALVGLASCAQTGGGDDKVTSQYSVRIINCYTTDPTEVTNDRSAHADVVEEKAKADSTLLTRQIAGETGKIIIDPVIPLRPEIIEEFDTSSQFSDPVRNNRYVGSNDRLNYGGFTVIDGSQTVNDGEDCKITIKLDDLVTMNPVAVANPTSGDELGYIDWKFNPETRRYEPKNSPLYCKIFANDSYASYNELPFNKGKCFSFEPDPTDRSIWTLKIPAIYMKSSYNVLISASYSDVGLQPPIIMTANGTISPTWNEPDYFEQSLHFANGMDALLTNTIGKDPLSNDNRYSAVREIQTKTGADFYSFLLHPDFSQIGQTFTEDYVKELHLYGVKIDKTTNEAIPVDLTTPNTFTLQPSFDTILTTADPTTSILSRNGYTSTYYYSSSSDVKVQTKLFDPSDKVNSIFTKDSLNGEWTRNFDILAVTYGAYNDTTKKPEDGLIPINMFGEDTTEDTITNWFKERIKGNDNCEIDAKSVHFVYDDYNQPKGTKTDLDKYPFSCMMGYDGPYENYSEYLGILPSIEFKATVPEGKDYLFASPKSKTIAPVGNISFTSKTVPDTTTKYFADVSFPTTSREEELEKIQIQAYNSEWSTSLNGRSNRYLAISNWLECVPYEEVVAKDEQKYLEWKDTSRTAWFRIDLRKFVSYLEIGEFNYITSESAQPFSPFVLVDLLLQTNRGGSFAFVDDFSLTIQPERAKR